MRKAIEDPPAASTVQTTLVAITETNQAGMRACAHGRPA
jgi:hypothetical protein